MALIEKVSALSSELCIVVPLGTFPDEVKAVAVELGLWEQIKDKPLIEQVEDCYALVFADAATPKDVRRSYKDVTSLTGPNLDNPPVSE